MTILLTNVHWSHFSYNISQRYPHSLTTVGYCYFPTFPFTLYWWDTVSHGNIWIALYTLCLGCSAAMRCSLWNTQGSSSYHCYESIPAQTPLTKHLLGWSQSLVLLLHQQRHFYASWKTCSSLLVRVYGLITAVTRDHVMKKWGHFLRKEGTDGRTDAVWEE